MRLDVFDVATCVAPSCPVPPGPVATLRQTKLLPDAVHAEWSPELLSLGGYRLYQVGAKELIPTAPAAAGVPSCTAAAGSEQCDRSSALTSLRAVAFTQVVGLCADGTTEGPL